MPSVTVYAWRGPLAGRRVEIDEADLDAATADDGWAQKLEPGTVLNNPDPSAPLDPKWKIPGVESPTADETATKPAAGKADESESDEDGESDEPAATSTRGRPRKR